MDIFESWNSDSQPDITLTLLLLSMAISCEKAPPSEGALGYWQEVITEGRGRYYNFNAKEDAYEDVGIGLIGRKNIKKRNMLNTRVLDYLARKRFWMRLEGVKKTFVKGHLKPLHERQLGAVRSLH